MKCCSGIKGKFDGWVQWQTPHPLPADVTRVDSSWSSRHDWQTTTVQNKPGHNLYWRVLASGGLKRTTGTTTRGRCRTRKCQPKRPVYVWTERSTMKCLLLLLSCCSCSLISLGGKTKVSNVAACNEEFVLTTHQEWNQRLKWNPLALGAKKLNVLLWQCEDTYQF